MIIVLRPKIIQNDLNVQVAYLIDDHKANETTATIFFENGDLCKGSYVFQDMKKKTRVSPCGDFFISANRNVIPLIIL